MRDAAVVAALRVALVSDAAIAEPTLSWLSDPYPGIHRDVWTDSAIPARIHLVEINLSSKEIGVYATKESDKGITTSDYAARIGAQVAVNGGPFAVSDFAPYGVANGDN